MRSRPNDLDVPSPRAPARRHLAWSHLPLLGLALLAACSGGKGCSSGCSALTPIPNGYPVDKRQPNAIELRLSQDLFTFLQSNAAALINQFLPGGEIPVPSSCGGSTEICCGQTCKIKSTFTALTFTPQPPSTMGVVARAKLASEQDMNFKYKTGVLGITLNCKLSYDTTRSGKPDVGLTAPLSATVDGQTQLTSLAINDAGVNILDFDDGDLKISGDLGCDIANFLKPLLTGTLIDALKKQLAGPLNTLFCQSCMSAADCSSFANQGCMNKQCMRNNVCMQELGVEGTLNLGSLIASAKGAGLEIYAVAGGYAAVENPAGGLSLGMLGGAIPTTSTACAPSRPAPQATPPPKSAALAGNATPGGKTFHAGAGISTLELDLMGHGFYQSGGLCLSFGTPDLALLSTSTLGALVGSLKDLTRDADAASVYLVMRPQQPPTFTLGKGTFKTDGTGKKVIDDPLLKVAVKDFAIDFYLYMDERYTRFMRLTADVNLPLGLDVDGQGHLVPILGDLSQALGNIRVSDSALLKESPQDLQVLFPKLLPVLLSQISTTLKPITLPSIMGFTLTPVEFASLEGQPGMLQFLGLFLKVGVGAMMLWDPGTAQQVETYADLVSLEVPDASRFAIGPAYDAAHGTRAVLRVDARGASGSMEWQYAVDDGLWRPFDNQHEIMVDDPVLGLAGEHHIDVRARVVGEPQSLDATPARVNFVVWPGQDHGAEPDFHGRTGGGGASGGCAGCVTARADRTSALDGLVTLLAFAGVALVLRRRPGRRLGRLGRGAAALPFLLALGLGLSACSSDSGTPPVPGEQFSDTDEIGRYLSAASRNNLIRLSAYDTTWGDLAYAEVSDPSMPIVWRVVDGLPAGPPDSLTDGAPRRGYTSPGPDVGRFTSLALRGDGTPVIAYQDVTNSAVKLAIGPAPNWTITTVATPPDGATLGLFTALSLDASDVPTVAYMATGIRGDGGKINSRLIVTQAQGANPTGPDSWTARGANGVVEEVQIPCAGFCAMGQACVAMGAKKDPQPSLCQPISTSCNPGCKPPQACIGNACTDVLSAPPQDIPEGTGLYVKLVRGPSGLTAVFHNRETGALKMAAEPDWVVKTLAGGDGTVDVGQYSAAALADDGTLHVAYVDAVQNQLLYRSVMGAMASMPEMVDDGLRGSGTDRMQDAVGAGAILFLDGGTPRVLYQDQTAGSLELASRTTSWAHQTKAQGGATFRGFYPQAVQSGGQWLLLDVVYDRNRDNGVLSAVSFTPM